MTNLQHTLPNKMSAILFLAVILKIAEFEGPGIVFKYVRCNEDMVKISSLINK